MAERQENGRLKESAGFPLDVKAPIEAVAQRAYTPDNDGSRGNTSDVVHGLYLWKPIIFSSILLISCPLIRYFRRNISFFFPLHFFLRSRFFNRLNDFLITDSADNI